MPLHFYKLMAIIAVCFCRLLFFLYRLNDVLNLTLYDRKQEYNKNRTVKFCHNMWK